MAYNRSRMRFYSKDRKHRGQLIQRHPKKSLLPFIVSFPAAIIYVPGHHTVKLFCSVGAIAIIAISCHCGKQGRTNLMGARVRFAAGQERVTRSFSFRIVERKLC